MKKITLYIAQSLDGYVATKDFKVKWLEPFNTIDFGEYAYEKFIENIDTIVQGSTTYDQFKPEYPGKNSYVFSYNADKRFEEGVTFVKSDVEEFVGALDEKTHKNIWLVGGPNLLAQFMNAGLVDEMIIFTMPVLLGGGIKLFKGIDVSPDLKLLNQFSFEKGVIMNHYKVSR